MQLENLLRQNTRLPYLFYGPPRSGKATLIAATLKQLGYHVKQLQRHECNLRLQSNTLLGRTAYIAKISNLREELDAQPGTLIVYCCINPYEFGTAEQLRGRFTLVDLGKQLKTHEFDRCVGGQRDPVRQAPWTALQWLRHAQSYAEQLAVVERHSELSSILYRNVENCSSIDAWQTAMEKFSLYDAYFPSYIDHSAAHRGTLECQALMPLLGGQLNYRGNGQTPYAKKPNRAAVEKHKALGVVEQPAKKARTAPQCKKCKVPLKGHKCPHRTKK